MDRIESFWVAEEVPRRSTLKRNLSHIYTSKSYSSSCLLVLCEDRASFTIDKISSSEGMSSSGLIVILGACSPDAVASSFEAAEVLLLLFLLDFVFEVFAFFDELLFGAFIFL